MKILAIHSSPRKKSNSSFLLNTITDELAQNGHSIEKINVDKMKIAPCRGCKACFTNKTKSCVQRDDMDLVKKAIAEADYIFMATPLYWFYVSAQLKLVIDRFYPAPYDIFKGKTIHLIMTGQFTTDDIGYQIVKDSFTSIVRYVGADFRYFFVSAHGETHPVWENQEAIAEAKEIARQIGSQRK